MWHIYLVLLIQILLGVGLILLLQRINQLKRQIDEITKEVKDYVSYVVDTDEEENEKRVPINRYDDETQSSLIQAVLGEIFP